MTASVHVLAYAAGIVDTLAEGNEWRMEYMRMNGKLDYFRRLVNAELTNGWIFNLRSRECQTSS